MQKTTSELTADERDYAEVHIKRALRMLYEGAPYFPKIDDVIAEMTKAAKILQPLLQES